MTSRPLPWARELRLEKRGQIAIISLLSALLGLCLVAPKSVIALTAILVSILTLSHAALRLMACLLPIRHFDRLPALTADTDLPAYTVLVPLKDEAHMAQPLMANLAQLRYPSDQIEILIICEAFDLATQDAVRAELRPPFSLVINPAGGPKTKPNALNYALWQARGKLITIYDAEDRPHPDQLLTAAAAFAAKPNWGALQAPLCYYNSRESWLTRQFALEYNALFQVWNPALSRFALPFPLGGTSNHMRRAALGGKGWDPHEGWDPHNVTEDADLSFRIAAKGWQIGYISPPTYEEAVETLGPWMDQRTRWMKGYMQSWLVHMHAPLLPGGWPGVKRQITLQLTLGISLLAGLFHLPILILVSLQMIYGTPHPLALGLLGAGYGWGITIGIVGAIRAKQSHLLRSVIMMPAYWLLLFWPSWRALFELRSRPFHWHKTEHGVTNGALPLEAAE